MVRITHRWETCLKAKVEGSRDAPYLVRLSVPEEEYDVVLVDCTCPRFEEMGECKHVVATILAAGKAGFDELIPGNYKLYDESFERSAILVLDRLLESDAEQRTEASKPVPSTLWDAVVEEAKEKGVEFSRPPKLPPWQAAMSMLSERPTVQSDSRPRPSYSASKPSRYWYLIGRTATREEGKLRVCLHNSKLKMDGTLGVIQTASISGAKLSEVDDAEDAAVLSLLLGNDGRSVGSHYNYRQYATYEQFDVHPELLDVLLPKLCQTGRFTWSPRGNARKPEELGPPIQFDHGPAFRLKVKLTKTPSGQEWLLEGKFQREDETLELTQPELFLPPKWAFLSDRVVPIELENLEGWVEMLRGGEVAIPEEDQHQFVQQVTQLATLPEIEWPEELQWEEVTQSPTPRFEIDTPQTPKDAVLRGTLLFDYGPHRVREGAATRILYDAEANQATPRDEAAEEDARRKLAELGLVPAPRLHPADPFAWRMARNELPEVVTRLNAAGWRVEVAKQPVRSAGTLSMSVSSGVDWFDLEGSCDFDGVTVGLPALLAAIMEGKQFITLDDGTQGMLPDEWLAKYAPLAHLGESDGNRVRYLSSQATLLDALLAAQPDASVEVDKTFAKLRKKLNSFAGVKPRKEPTTFKGELRPYQRDGLGWLRFLDEFSLGGCLADDMGLGKTIQILALLDQRRKDKARQAKATKKGEEAPPKSSLVVVPKSLIHNWIEEAAKFTPNLTVLDYTGLFRKEIRDQIGEVDLVVTTYGTVRRDITTLREYAFDYAILDEAQAIKNSSSQASKACRLLKARRRLAMTGTPVENHLGELWSLFEFLNPGMLGTNDRFQHLLSPKPVTTINGTVNGTAQGKGDAAEKPVPDKDVSLLAKALRPYMLRRTKQQVLTELPAKSEQTLYCELSKAELKNYNEIRDHYRAKLLQRIDEVGVKRSKIQVLSALLRLRQAACHPGLLDPKKKGQGSAKLDSLLEQIAEVIDGGHKALIFSQFTSLLAIVRQHLDKRKIVYEYLDGKTTKRQDKVRRFQEDEACPLFLISLKAGGHGLNLTAADYVFILDPWWNPAVEAQAVDRAHRMGQQRQVFAYRLIAQGTVEEKILELQQHKKSLADAIVSADNSLIRTLTADDLRVLLS
ncbi:MAG: DEAD/DEAH box helicase [Pirellulaceae bacterium]